MFIRSERLFLRPSWPEDREELLAAISDEQIVRNLARVPWPYSDEAARAFVSMGQDRRHPHFLVTVPGAGGARLVGSIGLHAGERPDEPVELGYWIARGCWGRGYATEAGRAALSIARTLGHRTVGACQFLDNPASARVLEKLGFRPAGLDERWSRARNARVPARRWRRELEAASGGDVDCGAMCAA